MASNPNTTTVMIDGSNFPSLVNITSADHDIRPYPQRWDAWNALKDDDAKAQRLVVATERIVRFTFRDVTNIERSQFQQDLEKATALLASTFVLNPTAHGVPSSFQPNVKRRKLADLEVEFFHSESVETMPSRAIKDIDPDAWFYISKWLEKASGSSFNGSTFATGKSNEDPWYFQDYGTNREGVGLRSNVR